MTSSCFDETYDYMFKILLIGDTGVGKTSVVQKFKLGTFTEKHDSTIGVDFVIKTVEVDGKLLKLQIWDTAGQERFRTITQSFYRGAYGVIVVYDTSNYSSFDSLPLWLDGVERCGTRSNMVKMLIGNKCDLKQLREVETDEGKTYANTHNFLSFMETSAKAHTNIDEVFLELAKELKSRFVDNCALENDPPAGLLLKGRALPGRSRIPCCGGGSSEER